MTVSDAARQLQVSDTTVRRWIGAGRLPAIRLGRTLRIRREDLEHARQGSAPPGQMVQRRGSPAAFLAGLQALPPVDAGVAMELDRIIAQGCERPAEAGISFD